MYQFHNYQNCVLFRLGTWSGVGEDGNIEGERNDNLKKNIVNVIFIAPFLLATLGISKLRTFYFIF